ncbi:MAG TPA: S41 family peptidase, partial [Prolixibacteraceae bacterium]|nr:S41 family peptidase [Prolixibacteraceae bacterium]
MNILNRWLYAFLFAGLVFTGCQKNDPEPEPEPEQAPKLTQKVNTFVKDAMDEVYLWYNQMPSIDIRYEFDTKEYFDKLLYKEDKWSFITDNAAELLSSYEGTEKTFGYALAWGSFWDTQGPTGEYFAIVEYVYPESPAAKAGIQRGDIFISVNGQKIKETNYMNLISGETIALTKGILTEQGIAPGSDLSLTSVVMNLDPVLIKKIIDYEGHKIGYLFYAHYIPNFNSSLDAAFQYFKSNQITDLVLDLRYNPGGEISAAQYLCSSIAPVSVVNNQSTLITKQWNDKYQAYFISTNATSQLKTTFDPNALVKLGLNKLYVLTTRYTASAS